jgi:hypothetical protein
VGAKEDFQRRNAERERRKQDAKAQKGFGKKTFRNPDRMIRFTWWVAAFTFCLGVIGSIQAYAFIQSERAFLLTISARFEGLTLSADKQLQLWLGIKNSGHATAVIENLNVSYKFGQPPKTPEYNPDASLTVSPIIGGADIPASVKSSLPNGEPFKLPQTLIDAIKNRTVRLSAYGFIEYHDDFSWLWFGRFRKTGFCYVYNPDGTATSVFDPCPERNYTYAY